MFTLGFFLTSPQGQALPEDHAPRSTAAVDDSAELLLRISQVEALWKAGSPQRGFLTAGNAIEYGLGYLKASKFEESLSYFADAIRIESNNPYAHLLLGLAHQGAGREAEARGALAEAVRLDPALLPMANTPTQPATRTASVPPPAAQATESYKIGDAVEVFYGGLWNPGRLSKVEGTGPSVYVYADFSFQGEPRSGSFFANGLRPASGTKPAVKPADIVDSGLAYGDYVCQLGRWDVGQKRMIYEQKGYFRLNPDGTYHYLDGGQSGRYRYDPASRTIQWLSGYFSQAGPSTTKYTPNTKVAQIDITFHTPSGDLVWSCGCNR